VGMGKVTSFENRDNKRNRKATQRDAQRT
jgi:hypothetical protein